MDCVKVALGNRGMTVEAARKIGKSEPVTYVMNKFHTAIFAWPCVRLDRLPYSCSHHPESVGMPLHDAVGINCKKGTTTENQGADVKYMG